MTTAYFYSDLTHDMTLPILPTALPTAAHGTQSLVACWGEPCRLTAGPPTATLWLFGGAATAVVRRSHVNPSFNPQTPRPPPGPLMGTTWWSGALGSVLRSPHQLWWWAPSELHCLGEGFVWSIAGAGVGGTPRGRRST